MCFRTYFKAYNITRRLFCLSAPKIYIHAILQHQSEGVSEEYSSRFSYSEEKNKKRAQSFALFYIRAYYCSSEGRKVLYEAPRLLASFSFVASNKFTIPLKETPCNLHKNFRTSASGLDSAAF